MLRILNGIRSRCNNPKQPSYRFYGSKGIKNYLSINDLVFLWKRDRANMMVKPSIDRKNSKGNYEVDNCRFIELSQNISLAHKGKVKFYYGDRPVRTKKLVRQCGQCRKLAYVVFNPKKEIFMCEDCQAQYRIKNNIHPKWPTWFSVKMVERRESQ